MSRFDDLGACAKAASRVLAAAGTDTKNKALLEIASQLERRAGEWLAANEKDIAAAKANGMTDSLLDRLTLTKERIAGIADGIRKIAELGDPIGEIIGECRRPNGLVIRKRRVPLGVIAIIFEARPNVAADSAALCLKSGNACILRGGKEAINSNVCAAGIMRDALECAGLPKDCICLVDDTSRESARELMHLDRYVDVLIPRGGPGLIRTAVRESSVPVIQTGEGVCHVYVDKAADLDMALAVIENAKVQRPSACNAAECLLIHESLRETFLPRVTEWAEKAGVTLHTSNQDWTQEFLSLDLNVGFVPSLQAAIDHINLYGSHHSDAIVTADESAAATFLRDVDSAAVYHNASTRFTDGGEFGMGAEIGISTDKLHARGPMGLEELTTYKYVIRGTGQCRS